MIHVKINKKELPENEMERIPYSCDEIRRRFENYLEKYK